MLDPIAEPLSHDVLESFDRLRADCARLEHLPLAVIEIRGEDRKGWLQGQASNDLKQLDHGASAGFCLCSATGQIQAICDIWGLKDRFILTTERSTAQAVMDRVNRYVIMEDVSAEDITERVSLISVQGPNATRVLSDTATLPTLDAADTQAGTAEAVALRSNRTGLGGWDLLIPRGQEHAVAGIREQAPLVVPEAYEIARIEAGIPIHGRDYDAKTLPPELGPAFEARHVSYRKGCYMGQEVLMRIYSRGHTNRTWVALVSDLALAPGQLASHPRRSDAGVVTSACYSPDYGYVAAAMLRNEAVLDGDVVSVSTPAGEVRAEVRHMPILRFD